MIMKYHFSHKWQLQGFKEDQSFPQQNSYIIISQENESLYLKLEESFKKIYLCLCRMKRDILKFYQDSLQLKEQNIVLNLIKTETKIIITFLLILGSLVLLFLNEKLYFIGTSDLDGKSFLLCLGNHKQKLIEF